MKLRDLNKIMNFNQDLFNIFTDYAFSLDNYFKNENNRIVHKELYDEYQILNQNFKSLKGKYKL